MRPLWLITALSCGVAAGCDPDGGARPGDGSGDAPSCEDGLTYSQDLDRDGFAIVITCTPGEGYAAQADDCDDADADVFPGAAEICDGADNDCDGLADDADPSLDIATYSYFYADIDGDGLGDEADAIAACSAPAGYVAAGGDCDDADPDVQSGGPWHADGDGDGYGGVHTAAGCQPPDGFLALSGDCADDDPDVNPGAVEVCDSVDNDCDALVDDADDPALPGGVDPDGFIAWYDDADGDLYGAGDPLLACLGPPGSVADDGDCADDDAGVSPGADEICDNGVDDDCDGDSWPCGFEGENDPTDAAVILTGVSSNLGYDMGVGDVDGDGQDDLLVSGYAAGAGSSYLLYGPVTQTGALPGLQDAAFDGAAAYDYAGKALATGGDLDGDGRDEIVIGAYGVDAYGALSGAAYLIYGGSTPFSGAYALDVSADAAWYGSFAGDSLGESARFVGDLDGDGRDELALGGSGYGEGAGAVLLVYGRPDACSGSALDTATDAQISGIAAADHLGDHRAIAGGMDLDGDGQGDLLLGAGGADEAAVGAGAAYLLYGSRWSGALSAADADASFRGGAANDELGGAVSAAGDVDGDGYDDVLIGSPDADPGESNEGVAWLIRGGSPRLAGPAAASTAAYAQISGMSSGDYAGSALAPAGDVDGDGYADVLVGAPGVASAAGPFAGAGYLLRGPFSGAVSLASAEASVVGSASYVYTGQSLASGDLNADGIPDSAISSYKQERLYLFFGGGM